LRRENVMEVRAASPEVGLQGATVVIGMMSDGSSAGGTGELLDGVDSALMSASRFEGKTGQLLLAPHAQAEAILLVGLGDEVSLDSLRSASGNAARQIMTERAVVHLAGVPVDGAVRAVVEGMVLGRYRYNDYKVVGDVDDQLDKVDVVGADEAELIDALAGAEATNLARDWTNTPARDQSPGDLAETIRVTATGAGISVEVWDEGRISDERLGGLLGVAAGSDRPPRLVTLRYRPEDGRIHLGLVGKGITFDTGGLTIKPGKSMEGMKTDMAGGAAAAAATIAVARLGVPVTLTAVIPITDNAIGGDATRPGDVLRPVEGPSVEVLNTDAEGRLILADGLGLIRRDGPDLIVDIATLTASARIALGDEIGAVFASDDQVADRVLIAAARAGEPVWEMPLFGPYRKALESEVADVKNVTGSRYGGAIAAALFLSNYTGGLPWAHLDIAGPARSSEISGERVKGATGFGVRTLIELARAMAESG
jgi:leucyl aminopeptidase